MRILKNILLWLVGTMAVLYIAVCVFFYVKQDDITFVPTKLSPGYKFAFPGNFSERKIRANDGAILTGLLFRADSSRGLIFQLHGQDGCVAGWGLWAPIYTALGYDVFFLDYRGYGKSEGKITCEKQFYDDVQAAYNDLKTDYPEKNIIHTHPRKAWELRFAGCFTGDCAIVPQSVI